MPASRPILRVMRGLGRGGVRAADAATGPGMLDRRPGVVGGVVDDLMSELEDRMDALVERETDVAYNRMMERYAEDKEQLADDLVATMQPRLQKMAADLISDANTQAVLGEQHAKFAEDVRMGVLPVVIGGVVVGVAATLIGVSLLR